MLHVGMDLSRHRIDVCVLDESGERVAEFAASPDAGGLAVLAAQFAGQRVHAAIESMNGARFVHDQLERAGWEVAIADAQKAKALAPLATKTDRIDAWVLAELSRRDLVPELWLPDPTVRETRERARYRLHLVQHRVAFKNRIHATLITFGHPCPVSDLFGVRGRRLLADLALPAPWAGHVASALRLLDDLERELRGVEDTLRTTGLEHPYLPLLVTAPGIGPILGYTIAGELGTIDRFASPKKLVGYTGLRPVVNQSGQRDWRGSLAKNGPKYLRWALVEAAVNAARHPRYRAHYQRTKTRLGRQRGAKIARVEIARKLAEAIWHMLTKGEPFAPAGPALPLAS